MRYKNYHVLFLLFVLTLCHSKNTVAFQIVNDNPNSLSIELINGNWFNGNTFENKTAWISNGILSFRNENAFNDTVIDLSGMYVIPPFAEAHNHNLESEYKLQERIDSYLDNGIFYVKLLSSIKKRIDPLMYNFNKPTGIDISLPHAPLTATGGHPIALRKSYLEQGYFDGLFNTLDEIESHGYFIIDNADDLGKKWNQILSFEPDFTKVMLLFSEEYEERKNDTAYFGNKGLDPELLPEIVRRAHQNNLRVSAHVETAHDFSVAIVSTPFFLQS